MKPLGQTRDGKMPTWEIGLPDKKDDAGDWKCTAVYYNYEHYIQDLKMLGL